MEKIKKIIKKVNIFEPPASTATQNIDTIVIDHEDQINMSEELSIEERLALELVPDLTVKSPSKYKFYHSIGRGGMKLIKKVYDKDTSRHIAVAELLNPEDKSQYARFIREAKITANLEHPNIVPIHDIGIDENGTPYFTMKLLRGETLASVLKKLKDGDPEYLEKWTLPRLLLVFRKICNGIGFAHTKNIIHLDLSPENVQIGQFGDVIILDWGLAKISGIDDEIDDNYDDEIDEEGYDNGLILKTVNGEIKGTPGYMAPEQAAGRNTERDQRTDIYALGSILYSILTYESPVQTRHVNKMLSDTIEGRINPIRKNLINRHIPSALIAVTLKAMRLDPNRRYQTVREMRKEIDAFISGFSTQAEHATLLTKIILFVKRHKLAVILTSIIFAMSIILIGLFLNEQKRLAGKWKLLYSENYNSNKCDLSSIYFKDSTLEKKTIPWKHCKNGLFTFHHNWMWLKNISLLNNLKIEATFKSSEPSSSLQIAFCANDEKISKTWFKPNGYTFQFGGFNRSNNVLYKGNIILATDMNQSSNILEKEPMTHKITITKVESNIEICVDGEVKINATDIFPPIGKSYNKIGIKLFSNKIMLQDINLYRLSLPEKASPLIAGDALVENFHFEEAVKKYLTIAENYDTTQIAEKALAKAYITAATKLKDPDDLLKKIKFKIKLNFPKYSFAEEILEVDALRAWRLKNYTNSLKSVKKLFELNKNTNVIAKMLQLPHNKLPNDIADNFLKYIAKTSNIVQLDISNYGLHDLSSIKNMKLIMLDCSKNNLTNLEDLKNMKLEVLDCSYNSLSTFKSLSKLKVKELNCSINPANYVEPLTKLPLTYLNLSGNKVFDVQELLKIKSLKQLVISPKTININVLKGKIPLLSNLPYNINNPNSSKLFWEKVSLQYK
jgi:serine/threonine protein kinase